VFDDLVIIFHISNKFKGGTTKRREAMVRDETKTQTNTKAKIKYGGKDLKKLLSELIEERYVLLINNK